MDNAGFWKRFWAYLFDEAVLLVFPVVGFLAFYFYQGRNILASDPWLFTAFLVGIHWFYFARMESSPKQATLGKLMLGIKVTDLAGERLGFARASLRYLVKLGSLWPTSGLLGLMVGLTAEKRGLHDFVAGSRVVVDVNPDPCAEADHAGFWRRFCALAIDLALVVVLPYLLCASLGVEFGKNNLVGNGLAVLTLWWLYSAAFESSGLQGTLGKAWMGIKVVDKQGEGIGFLRATVRCFTKALTLFYSWGLAGLLVAFTRERQALHDMVARCHVVNKSEDE